MHLHVFELYLTMTYSEYRYDWHRSLVHEDILHAEQIFTASAPRHRSLSRTVIELVLNICEELDFSSAVEFTCLDTFDSYVASFYHQTIRRYGNILHRQSTSTASHSSSGAVGDNHIKRQADEWMVAEVGNFGRSLMVRLVAVLMLSAKLIGNNTVKPTKIAVFIGLLCIISEHRESDPVKLKQIEFEVFQTLKFSIKPSAPFCAMELFVSLAANLHQVSQRFSAQQMAQLELGSVKLLRVAYITRDHIHQRYRDKFGQLDWEVTIASIGPRQTIWIPAAVVLCASYLPRCSCNDWQRRGLQEALVVESGLDGRSVRQLADCLRDMYDCDNGA